MYTSMKFFVCLRKFSTVSTLQEAVQVSHKHSQTIFNNLKLKIREPKNEPVLTYLDASPERVELLQTLCEMESKIEDIPIVIGDKEFKTDQFKFQVMPHRHNHKIAQFYYADEKLINNAIHVAIKAQKEWDLVPFKDRLVIWEKILVLLRKNRFVLNAATMLGQAKTVQQAEIDSAAELIDFFEFNSCNLTKILDYEPISPQGVKNSYTYRGIDGFWSVVTPFNFTAIAGNLAFTPALLGNAVLWKPTDTSMLSNWIIFKLCREAGVPPGVVNFIPADGPTFGKVTTRSKHFAGLNFTGSSATFKLLWKAISNNLDHYINFPRIIGECGGKNFHFIHPSADALSVVTGTIRSAFEYSGQKCSACSRMYIPQSLWPQIKDCMVHLTKKLVVGDVKDLKSFTSAVIDESSFKRLSQAIQYAKSSKDLKIICGGTYSNECGFYIQPTIIETTNPIDKLMTTELFGPIVCVYPYPDDQACKVLEMVEQNSVYALTGSVFAQDVDFLKHAYRVLKYACGNLYLNDKSTGSVVGQQPFGGARLSGTNDKAGGPYYILRYANPVTIKESFVPLIDVEYPHMK